MSERPRELRDYYERELTYLRRKGKMFAQDYPRVAGRLELYEDECSDPHVERLIESFAFLTARIQRSLDAEFPQLSAALLEVLYPQLVRPIPSMSIARFELSGSEGKVTSGAEVDRGTALFAETSEGVARFRTCHQTTLWPLKVDHVGVDGIEMYDTSAAGMEGSSGPRERAYADIYRRGTAVLRVRLKVTHAGTFEELAELTTLRFHLGDEMRIAGRLYELLFCNVRDVWVTDAVEDGGLRSPLITKLDPAALSPFGFGEHEEILPREAPGHPAYQLLQQYFTFPRGFLFFELSGLERHLDARRDADAEGSDRPIDLLFVLDRDPRSTITVSRDSMALGCVPIINLFHRPTDPITIDHAKSEYRVLADARAEATTEVHSLERVTSTSTVTTGETEVHPFFSVRHSEYAGQFWASRRVPHPRREVYGSDFYLTFLDLNADPAVLPGRTVYGRALCTNRDLASRIPAGYPLAKEEGESLGAITCVRRPTPQVHPGLGGRTLWRLVSQLSLNHLSLSGEEGLSALREILTLYAVSDRPSTGQEIRGIKEMRVEDRVHRLGRDAWRGFCRGLRVTLRFDENEFAGGSAFLLAAVLRHFFGLYASVNSFVQLAIEREGEEGTWKEWPPMAGRKPLM